MTITTKNTGIIINGNGNKFILNNYQVKVRAEGASLNNIKFESYKDQAISVYNTKNVTLDKIELIGAVNQSIAGIDIGAGMDNTSSVILSNITSRNHTSAGIRVKNGSKVKFKGGNIHIRDAQDLYVIDEDNRKNDIKDEKQQYVDRKTSVNNPKHIYYTCHNSIDVSNFDELKEAITSKRATISLKKDIELKEELTLETKVSNITINGEGHTVISKEISKQTSNNTITKDKSKLIIKGKNVELNNVKFKDYKDQAILLYDAEDVLLKDIELIGDSVNSAVGIDKGMETGAAGGVKIRNGKNAYIGSNNFDDVPLLTYIYGDLTREDSILYNTTIYNNLFHCKTNFGGEGTGILYYQSFRDGDNLEFKIKDSDGNVTVDKWDNAFGDVKNFLIYKNEFLSDDRDQITISGRAQTAYNNKQFLAYGNKYLETKDTVNYNKGNLILSESQESEVSSKLNAGYDKYKNVNIPLTPATVDYTYINKLINPLC